ncbi:bacterio-opsin activator domain-containing protein [Haladaptatus sp. NG-WS-4]
MTNRNTRESDGGENVSNPVIDTSILHDVLDDSDIGVFILDSDFAIVWANETIGEYFGLDTTAIRGRDKPSLIQDALGDIFESGDEFVRRVLATYEDNTSTERFECHVLADEKRAERYLEHRSKPIIDGIYAGGRVELYYEITARKEREARLETYEAVVETARDPICVLDLDYRFQLVNPAFTELLGIEREALVGEHISIAVERGLITEAALEEAAAELDRLFERDDPSGRLVTSADEFGIDFESYFSVLTHDGEPVGIISIGREITERVERERMLADQRDELEILNRVNRTIRGVNQKLVSTTTPDEVVQAVCDELVSSELYQSALFVDRGETPTEYTARGVAGMDDELTQALSNLDVLHERETPADHVYETGELVVVPHIGDEPTFPDEFKTTLTERGYRSIILIPVQFQTRTLGVLIVYANRSKAFDRRERTVFEELGETVGSAINAAEQTKLLHADTVLELVFRTTDEGIFVARTSKQTGATFTLEGLVPTHDGLAVEYIAVDGMSPEKLVELAADASTVAGVRVIETSDDGGLLEMSLTEHSLAMSLLKQGARLRGGVASDGVVHLTVEVSPDTNLRSLITQLQRQFPDIELSKKTTIERPVRTVQEFRHSIGETLTERQQTALRTAYFSGYFEWPRDSTAEELAGVFDVSPPTYHQHLRNAQRKVFALLYDT